MIKDIIIHISAGPRAHHPRPSPSPGSPPQNTRQGDGLARHRATRRASCSTPRSRCKAAATPSLEGKTPEISAPQASQIPGRGDLQQALADYLEAAGLQEAPNDTPLSRTAISKISQLTHNALHANDISHMMKRRLRDGSLPRRVRPTPSAPPSSPTCSARACRSQATPTRAPPGSITGGTRRSRANIVERISILKKTAVIRLPSMKPAASRRAR